MSEFQERRAAAAAEASTQPAYPASPAPAPAPVVEAELEATKKRLDAERDREIYIAKYGTDPVAPAKVAPTPTLTAHELDIVNSRLAATKPAPFPADVVGFEPRFKVGQRVTVNLGRRRGRVAAIVTKSNAVPGKKQELVECRTADGSVQDYWSDEVA